MRDELFEELIESIHQAKAIIRGEAEPSRTFEYPDVKELRARHHLSQSEFAKAFGLSLGTVRNWEQGRRKPQGPAAVLLKVAQARPEIVREIVKESKANGRNRRAEIRHSKSSKTGRDSKVSTLKTEEANAT